jgi:hypothetical protein
MGVVSDPYRTRRQAADVRRVIVADCYKRGLSISKTCQVVMGEMGMDKVPSKKTIFNDRLALMKEWKEERLSDMDDLITLELARIDEAIVELWEAWKKSKTDHKSKFSKQKGELADKAKPGEKPKVNYVEQGQKEEINFGDPRYISEIRAQLQERRKLLGMYAPDKTNNESIVHVSISKEDVETFKSIFNETYK